MLILRAKKSRKTKKLESNQSCPLFSHDLKKEQKKPLDKIYSSQKKIILSRHDFFANSTATGIPR